MAATGAPGSSIIRHQPYNPRAQQQQQHQAAEELSLTNLPNDVLRILLVQKGIGAAELCALECTAWLLRQLIDDNVRLAMGSDQSLAHSTHTNLCPAFQCFFWQAALQYETILQRWHFFRMCSSHASWQPAQYRIT